MNSKDTRQALARPFELRPGPVILCAIAVTAIVYAAVSIVLALALRNVTGTPLNWLDVLANPNPAAVIPALYTGFVSLMLSLFKLIYAMYVRIDLRFDEQDERLDAKIDAQGKHLGTRIDEQGKHLGAGIDEQGKHLGARIDEQGKHLGARIDEQGRRIDEQGRRIDEQGRMIEEQGRKIEEQGRKIDKQGRRIDRLFTQLNALVLQLVGLGKLEMLEPQSETSDDADKPQERQGATASAQATGTEKQGAIASKRVKASSS